VLQVFVGVYRLVTRATFILGLVGLRFDHVFGDSVADIVIVRRNININCSFPQSATELRILVDLLLLGLFLASLLGLFLLVFTDEIVVVVLRSLVLVDSSYALLHEVHELVNLRAEHMKRQAQL
jgi:hypothetical protein